MTAEEKRKEQLINSILEKFERLQKIREEKAAKQPSLNTEPCKWQ